MTRVLLLGAAGQLGRALAATVPAGAELFTATRGQCDLAQPEATADFLAAAAPDLIINAAAYTAVDRAESEQETAFSVNCDAVATLAAQHQGKLVHISTDFVFDGHASRPYHPDAKRAPLSVYGRSKAAGEDHLRAYDLLVRTSWVYSTSGTNFVRTMLRLMAERDALTVVADQIGAPTWATGLAQTIWGLVGKDARGTFHHSDAGAASWFDFAIAIQEEALLLGLLDTAIPVIPVSSCAYPAAARRPAMALMDSSATRELLDDGYVHWRKNLRKMLEEESLID